MKRWAVATSMLFCNINSSVARTSSLCSHQRNSFFTIAFVPASSTPALGQPSILSRTTKFHGLVNAYPCCRVGHPPPILPWSKCLPHRHSNSSYRPNQHSLSWVGHPSPILPKSKCLPYHHSNSSYRPNPHSVISSISVLCVFTLCRGDVTVTS
jgi:hypothetical protein